MEPQRHLRCLGPPVLFAPSGEPVRFRTRKHLALLVYLAVEGRSQRRDRLSELLWPNVSSTEARHSLATALSILRPRLGIDGLETSRDHVRLVPGRVTLDLERLQSGDVLGSEVSGPLEVAGFLEGFEISDSTEFTHWKDRQQARLLPIIKDALLVLIDRCRRTGDTRQIEQLADRMLSLDDLCEEAVRAKMEARAFAGDRLTALEIFEAWKKKLAEELQAVPSDLVEGMAVRLRRRGWERTTLANIPNVPTDQWRGRPFIGRAAEYRLLYESWESVQKGGPGHALILGDSGVGKTTLVQRLTTAAALQGAAISRVQCHEIEREIPYSTLTSLILGLLDRPGVSATSPEALGELSRIVPQVKIRFANVPPPSESEGETARIRLTEAFSELLATISEEHPVILVIDDLHLADDVSLAAIHLTMRRLRGRPLMVVMMARTGELQQISRAGRLRESAHVLEMREIELAPLTEAESRQMLDSMLAPGRARPNVVEERALLSAACGYPMALELLVQDWQVSGEQSLALSVEAMTTDFATPGPAEATYRQILNRITVSLTTTTHSVLNLASILGRRLNDLSLYALVDISAGQTVSSMADLVQLRVFRDGAQGLEFVNELIRGAAYLGVPHSLRRILHGNIADCLIRQFENGDEELGLEIAWHCIRAGRCEEATSHLLAGARQAMRTGAIEAAEKALSSALSHLRGEERTDTVILLAEVLQEQGRWLDSLNLIEPYHDYTDRKSGDWFAVLRIAAQFNLFEWSSSDTAEKIDILIKVIRLGASTPVRIAAARTATALTAVSRDQTQIRRVLEALALIPEDDLTRENFSHLSLARAKLACQLHERLASLREIGQALSSIDCTRTVSTTTAQIYLWLGIISCIDGEYLMALRYYESAHAVSVRLGNDSLRVATASNMALVHGRLGNYEKQLEYAEESMAFSRTDSANYHELLASYSAAFACIFLNRLPRARELISRANERIPHAGLPPWALQAWLLYSADLLFLMGDREAAWTNAVTGTTGANADLHARDFAGIFSRWIAALAGHNEDRFIALQKLLDLLGKLSSYDAIDRAEIVASLLLLQRQIGKSSGELEQLLARLLEPLPPTVTYQLKCLGALT